jgi:predicted dehydrogenase
MTMRVAVIGVGMMGRNHARVYSEMPQAELVGVADVDLVNAQAVARRCGCPAYDDYQRLLDEQRPDAVSIVVPTVDHYEVGLQVIERGIHLLLEKPLSFTLEEGRALIAAAARSGLRLMVGHIERFNPAVIALKDHLAEGTLGRVFQIDAHRNGPFPARVRDVGVVIDLAVHDLDIMRYVTGSEIVRVYAETQRQIHSQHEDLVSGMVRLADGSIGNLTTNWLTPTKIRELYVTGERGMFRVDYLTQDLYFYENAITSSPDWGALRMLRGVSEGNMVRYSVAKKEPLLSELEQFLAAVETGQPTPVSGEDGLRAIELALALVLSGMEHRAIDVARGPAL